jgi:hypothetical protein
LRVTTLETPWTYREVIFSRRDVRFWRFSEVVKRLIDFCIRGQNGHRIQRCRL